MLTELNEAATTLAEWAFAEKDRGLGRLAGVWLLPVVARTYAAAPGRSRRLVEYVVEQVAVSADADVDLLFRLAHVVEDIWRTDPAIVSEFYRRMFANSELSAGRYAHGRNLVRAE